MKRHILLYSICFFFAENFCEEKRSFPEVRAVRRLIGYSLFCIALGMLIALFIQSHVFLVIMVGVLLLIGYQLFCC